MLVCLFLGEVRSGHSPNKGQGTQEGGADGREINREREKEGVMTPTRIKTKMSSLSLWFHHRQKCKSTLCALIVFPLHLLSLSTAISPIQNSSMVWFGFVQGGMCNFIHFVRHHHHHHSPHPDTHFSAMEDVDDANPRRLRFREERRSRRRKTLKWHGIRNSVSLSAESLPSLLLLLLTIFPSTTTRNNEGQLNYKSLILTL